MDEVPRAGGPWVFITKQENHETVTRVEPFSSEAGSRGRVSSKREKGGVYYPLKPAERAYFVY